MAYIYQSSKWAKFYWDNEKILSLLSDVKYLKGLLLGKIQGMGLISQDNASLDIITEDITKSSEIEGNILNVAEVRSSIARKLGMIIDDSIGSHRNIDSLVEMILDAIHNYDSKLTKERLIGWQSALFIDGYSGLHRIKIGDYRDDSKGAMQVVSGRIGKEVIHYQAPDASSLDKEMTMFLDWFNADDNQDLIIKAAIAHLWFVILHPFDDGNGRIARAITDMLLARSDNSKKRFYSMSSQIQKMKNSYYDILERTTNKDSLDITNWLQWFLNCLSLSISASEKILDNIFRKHAFLQRVSEYKLNLRQKKIIDMLFDNFKGNLTSSKWAKINKVSQDSANRDIAELVKNKLLVKVGDGSSTHYVLGLEEGLKNE